MAGKSLENIAVRRKAWAGSAVSLALLAAWWASSWRAGSRVGLGSVLSTVSMVDEAFCWVAVNWMELLE